MSTRFVDTSAAEVTHTVQLLARRAQAAQAALNEEGLARAQVGMHAHASTGSGACKRIQHGQVR